MPISPSHSLSLPPPPLLSPTSPVWAITSLLDPPSLYTDLNPFKELLPSPPPLLPLSRFLPPSFPGLNPLPPLPPPASAEETKTKSSLA